MNKFFKIYLLIFSFIIFVTSAIYIFQLIDALHLPKGIVSALVNYGYLLIHIFSFISMLHYGNELFEQNKK